MANKTTIKKRLIILMLYLALFVLLINSLLFFFRDRTRIYSNLIHEQSMHAMFLSNNCVSPLFFNDVQGVNEVLQSTDPVPSVAHISVYDKNGLLFTEYGKPWCKYKSVPTLQNEINGLPGKLIRIEKPITFREERIGTILLFVTQENINKQLFVTVLINLLIFSVLLFAAFLIALLLQKSITSPIEKLVSKASEIAESGEYNQIAGLGEYKEISNLYEAINYLLRTISNKEIEQRSMNYNLLQNRKHLQSIIDSNPIAISVVNQDLEVEYTNPEFVRLFGWTLDDIKNVNDWFKNAYPDAEYRKEVMTKFQENLQYSIRNDCPTEPHEVHVTSKDGQMRIVEVLGCPIDQGILYLYTDITEKKKTSEAVKRLNRELESKISQRTAELNEVNKELEAFAYSVSHDLRAPLRGIHGFVSALIEDKKHLLDEEGIHYLDRISQGTMKMSRLIDDILKLSRISRHTLFKRQVDITRISKDIVAELQSDTSERSVEIEIEDNLTAFGDEVLITVLLTNLISNAWKYSSKTERPVIKVSSRQYKDKEVISVKDNGAGFSMQYYDKLFVPFQRLHGGTEYKGTGIGLATVFRIVKKHNGNIWAEAAVEEGAEFMFWLPKEEEDE